MDYSYLAGLLDGDGSISLVKPKRNRIPYVSIHLCQIATEEFLTIGVELDRPVYTSTVPATCGLPKGEICWFGKDAEALLDKGGPLLRLKAKQVRIIREFQRARADSNITLMLESKARLEAANKAN